MFNKSINMLKESKEGPILAVKIVPKSSRNQIVGWENDSLKIKLKAIPEKGTANKELIEYLSEVLDIPKSKIILTHGATSRHKRICFLGIDKKILEKRLLDIL